MLQSFNVKNRHPQTISGSTTKFVKHGHSSSQIRNERLRDRSNFRNPFHNRLLIVKKHEHDGLEAIRIKKRGRKRGSGRTLSPKQEKEDLKYVKAEVSLGMYIRMRFIPPESNDPAHRTEEGSHTFDTFKI